MKIWSIRCSFRGGKRGNFTEIEQQTALFEQRLHIDHRVAVSAIDQTVMEKRPHRLFSPSMITYRHRSATSRLLDGTKPLASAVISACFGRAPKAGPLLCDTHIDADIATRSRTVTTPLSHAAGHKAADRDTSIPILWPDHGAARPVRLCDQCFVRNVDPIHLGAAR